MHDQLTPSKNHPTQPHTAFKTPIIWLIQLLYTIFLYESWNYINWKQHLLRTFSLETKMECSYKKWVYLPSPHMMVLICAGPHIVWKISCLLAGFPQECGSSKWNSRYLVSIWSHLPPPNHPTQHTCQQNEQRYWSLCLTTRHQQITRRWNCKSIVLILQVLIKNECAK